MLINLQGPDYDETSECPNHIERVSGFLRRWELASSIEETPSNISLSRNQHNHSNHRHHSHNHHHHHYHDQHSQSQSRAIPLSHRVVNRLDGLEDIQHRPSPNMPRHILESISQSPTQSVLKGSLTSTLFNQISDNDDYSYREHQSTVQYHGTTRNPNIIIAGQQHQQQTQQFAATGTNVNRKKGFNAPHNLT